MKLTRREFLKGGAITALALVVGVKPRTAMPATLFGLPVREWKNPPAYHEGDIVLGDFSSYFVEVGRMKISPELMQADTAWDNFMNAIHRSIQWEKAHPWPGHWTVSTTEAYQEYAEEHGRPPVTDDEKSEAFLMATLNRLDAT